VVPGIVTHTGDVKRCSPDRLERRLADKGVLDLARVAQIGAHEVDNLGAVSIGIAGWQERRRLGNSAWGEVSLYIGTAPRAAAKHNSDHGERRPPARHIRSVHV